MAKPPTIAPPRLSKGSASKKKVAAPKLDDGTWRTVLVAEPDSSTRARLIRILREAAKDDDGNERKLAIHEADNGNAAWTLVETLKPDVVVAEILLDGLSGLQLLRRLRERYAEDSPRFLFVTGMSNEVDRYWALRNGASAFVIKPFEDEILRERSVKLLRNDEPHREGSWHSRL